MLLCITAVYLFSLLYNTLLCIPHFIYPFYCWWTFGLFPVLPIKNNAARNIIVYDSWCSLCMSFYRMYTLEWNFYSMSVSSVLLEKAKCFPEWFFFPPIYIPIRRVWELLFLNSPKHVPFPGFRTKQSGGCVVSLIVALFCISLIINEVEHLFMYLFTIWISPFVKYLYKSYIGLSIF